jgi:hypothetical protein
MPRSFILAVELSALSRPQGSCSPIKPQHVTLFRHNDRWGQMKQLLSSFAPLFSKVAASYALRRMFS